jgi:hypothetical protein
MDRIGSLRGRKSTKIMQAGSSSRGLHIVAFARQSVSIPCLGLVMRKVSHWGTIENARISRWMSLPIGHIKEKVT